MQRFERHCLGPTGAVRTSTYCTMYSVLCTWPADTVHGPGGKARGAPGIEFYHTPKQYGACRAASLRLCPGAVSSLRRTRHYNASTVRIRPSHHPPKVNTAIRVMHTPYRDIHLRTKLDLGLRPFGFRELQAEDRTR